MATETELLNHVKTSISTALGADSEQLKPETKLFADLGVDSVDLLDVAYEIEQRTGCELEISEFYGGEDKDAPQPGTDLTLGDLVKLLSEKLA